MSFILVSIHKSIHFPSNCGVTNKKHKNNAYNNSKCNATTTSAIQELRCCSTRIVYGLT